MQLRCCRFSDTGPDGGELWRGQRGGCRAADMYAQLSLSGLCWRCHRLQWPIPRPSLLLSWEHVWLATASRGSAEFHCWHPPWRWYAPRPCHEADLHTQICPSAGVSARALCCLPLRPSSRWPCKAPTQVQARSLCSHVHASTTHSSALDSCADSVSIYTALPALFGLSGAGPQCCVACSPVRMVWLASTGFAYCAFALLRFPASFH